MYRRTSGTSRLSVKDVKRLAAGQDVTNEQTRLVQRRGRLLSVALWSKLFSCVCLCHCAVSAAVRCCFAERCCAQTARCIAVPRNRQQQFYL